MSDANAIGPTHYKRGTIEVWDFIRDQDLNYFLGNAIKYICRAGYKDSKRQDLEKAIHYLQKELEHVESVNPIYKPHPIFEPDLFRTPSVTWSTGAYLPYSDGFPPSDTY